jgi:hypothetical protein
MDGRDIWTYFQRLFLGMTTFILLYLVQVRISSGAQGLYFFYYYFLLLILISSVGTLNIFSSAVSSEKEGGLMDLLILTGLRPFSFLAGRFSAKFMQLLNLMVLQLPFCIFGITLGGVNTLHLVNVFIYLLSWLLFIAGVAYLCSVLYSNRKEAMTVSGLVTMSMLIFPWSPLSRLDTLLGSKAAALIIFYDTWVYLGAFVIIFYQCCVRFEENSVRSLSFLGKRKEKKRKVQLWMSVSPIVRIAMKNRLRVRFSRKNAIVTKDNYLHPPPPLFPFKVLYIENPGCAMMLLIFSSGIAAILLIFNTTILIMAVLFYLTYKCWSRLVLLFNYELEQDTFQSLALLPWKPGALLKEKMRGADMYPQHILLLYIVLTAIVLMNHRFSFEYKIAILSLPVLKYIADYLTLLAVFRARNAPKATAFAVIAFTTVLFFAFPQVCVPLYASGIFFLRKKCASEMALQLAK